MTASALWTASDAIEATTGQKVGDWAATGISIDTRTLETGDLFVALLGPNFDGHDFVKIAFENGATAALVSEVGPQILNGKPGLIVADTLDALRALAAAGRTRTTAKIAAITGSVGKTGTKEALAHVLAPQGATSFSRSSLNNHWGVPLSLARMPADTDFGIFEIGMNHPGEITPLAGLARPHVAVVTAIAPAHMAFFKSLEEVARAKAEVFSGLDGGIAIINRDTEHFNLLAESALATGAASIISFGHSAKADMRLIECLSDTTGISLEARWNGKSLKFRVGQPGLHWAYNSLAVLATVDALGGNMDEAASAMASLPSLPGRGAVHVIRWGNGRIRLIDDSYNANPESMNAALKTLGHMPKDRGRRVAILGDMLELGEISAAAHAELKTQIAKNDIDIVFLAGPGMAALADVLPSAKLGGISDTVDGLLPIVLSGLQADDIVSVKASNGIGLWSIVKQLTAAAPVRHAANDS
ncbi:MAG: UDP-N-acetylmuramoyl-tripeptide--D-alanyl-D-alanine ligase [Rhodospirillaceae bacterium]|nr:UDP-N-acetylmuramoyl-tripeptide--D-alanyl-D-alanine ligase [Rhodospirillaceae bacterium]